MPQNREAMQPQFSIIIATYNVAETLPGCLASIWAQQRATFEVLVADGASTDGTTDILEALRARFAAYVSAPDRGVYDAWNKVIDQATGEWVVFLGADDVLAGPTVLADAKQQLDAAAGSEVMFAYGQVELRAGDKVIERFGETPFPPGPNRIRRQRPFSHTALFNRRIAFERFGKFDPNYKIAGDSEFLTRVLKHEDVEVVRLDLDVAVMGMGGLSSSVDSRLTAYLEDMRALRTHGEILPPLSTLGLASRAFAAVAINRLFGRDAALKASNAYRSLTGRAHRTEI